ncbi:MAG: hypothetical protein UZ01_00475 [Candidatus Brocadia sinica]|nr:MAG: hypothetical protein UZ01_00475 [Candidatus Brocadia sinica]MCK6470040.1 hypothetical protein [Candidatus Brocadia sinica]
MKEEVIFCKAQKTDVIKSEYCPTYECNNCPRDISVIPKKKSFHNKRLPKKRKIKTEEYEHYFSVYTLHPQKQEYQAEELPDSKELNKIPAHVTEITNDLGKSMIPLVCAKGAFHRTQNPVYAIQAFLLAHEAGIYPPLWVLNYMHKIFKNFWKSNGKKSLDALFGFSRGKGQEPAFKSVFNEDRDEMLMKDVFRLTILGYSVSRASHMVSRRLEETKDWDKTGLSLSTLTADSINDRYLKKWSKIFNCDFTRKHTLNWLAKNKMSFLEKFPEDCFYDGVK